jgi:hypothetical protein
LGVTGFYRDFYRNGDRGYSEDAYPLTELTKDTAPASFDPLPADALKAFETIRAYWANPRNLGRYVDGEPVDLVTDASSTAYGGVIEQKGRPLAFFSGKFTPAERNWSTTDRELFACLKAHEKFGYLLQGPTTWHTDHQVLQSLRTVLADNPRRARWRETLDNFPFLIKYRPGKQMHVDGLTRHSADGHDAKEVENVLEGWRFGDKDATRLGKDT